MNEMQVRARAKIFEGKLDAFKRAAEACVQSVRSKDQRTGQYDWFFNHDQTECVVLERYADSDAVLQHIENLGGLLGALLETCELSIELYGRPSAELLEASSGLQVDVYEFFLGI